MIKNYLEFINESTSTSKDLNLDWSLDEVEIKTYFTDLTDEGWKIESENNFYDDGRLTQRTLPNKKFKLAYDIKISIPDYNTKPVDVTEGLLFAIDILKEKVDGKIIVMSHDYGEITDVSDITLNKFVLLKPRNRDTKVELIVSPFITESLNLIVVEDKEFILTELEVAKYYGWDETMGKETELNFHKKGEKIYLHYRLGTLASMFLNNLSHFNTLNTGRISASNYRITDFLPKNEEILEILTDENAKTFTDKTLVRQGTYNTNIRDELAFIIADYRLQARKVSDYNELVKEFDRKLLTVVNFYKEGDVYKLPFDERWLKDFDYLEDYSLSSMFEEYARKSPSLILTPEIKQGSDDDINPVLVNSDIKKLLAKLK